MKLALRYIPTEVWVDIFRYPWISRWELGKIVDRFRNRRFAEFLQFFLHEWGKQTLGYMVLDKTFLKQIPHTPMPENIKLFRYMNMEHFDLRTVDFLRLINALFTGVNLNLSLRSTPWTNTLSTIIDHLAPLIHGIHSLSFNHNAIPLMEQYFAQKLVQINALSLTIKMDDWLTQQAAINFALNWLTSKERSSAEPRFLEVFTDSENVQQIHIAVQQQFLSANRPCTFAIQLVVPGWKRIPITDFHLDNNLLGEQLHGQSNGFGRFRINRHQPNAGTALQEWVEQTNWECSESSVIEFSDYLTIGPLNANAGAIEVDDNAGEEEKEEQPSTSAGQKRYIDMLMEHFGVRCSVY